MEWVSRATAQRRYTLNRAPDYPTIGVHLTFDSDLAYNELAGVDTASILKRQPARCERVELLPILEECINTIGDLRLRQAVGMRLDVCTTERGMAKRLNIPVPTFHGRLHRAYRVLRPMLEARGVEPSWFGA